MTAKELIKNLNSPDSEYSLIPFWFLNDELTESKIEYQLAQFKSKGIDVVIPHARIGLPDDFIYLSDEFFDKMRFIVERCKAHDMKVILYDEGMYPSGAAGGLIAKNYPQLKAKGLFLSKDKQGDVIFEGEKGRLVYTYAQGRIRGLHYGEDDGEENQPFAADILNPDAVDLFIEYTHKAYYNNLKEYFGSTIIGFFTDEPSPVGRCREKCFAWYENLENELIQNGGKVEDLFALFDGQKNKTTELYVKLVREREVNVFYKKLKDWCNAHGLFLCGHSEKSDDVSQLLSFDVPGQDLVFRFVAPDTGDAVGVHSVLGKIPADIAEYTDASRNMCEVLGVCGKQDNQWDLPPSDIKWFLDYLAVRGTSAFVFHAFYYSLDGKRKDERPPDVGMNTLWWEDYRYFSDYVKRVSYLNSGIKSTASTAVTCKDNDVPVEYVKPFYENQIEFRYLPQFVMDNGNAPNFKRVLNDGDEVPFDALLEERALKFNNFQPNVRINHFKKQSVEVYMIANVGDEKVVDSVTIDCDGKVVVYDLWTGEYYTEHSRFNLCLAPRACIALIIDDFNSIEDKECASVTEIVLEFKKVSQSLTVKRYRAEYVYDGAVNPVAVIEADETVRWYVNGKKVYATFFNKHACPLYKFLSDGKNVVEIEVVASASNLYGDKKVDFGLKI